MKKIFGFIIFASVFSMVFSASLFNTEARSQFSDVNDRYAEAVDYIVGQKYANGKSETQFGTAQSILRIDAAVMVARVLGFNESSSNRASGFSDVPEDRKWAVNALKSAGVISGKSATSFGSYDTMTRAEMAKVIASAYNLQASSDGVPFTDVNKTFAPFVAALVDAGITQGKSVSKFGAADPIRRGEFAIFIYAADHKDTDLTPPEVLTVE